MYAHNYAMTFSIQVIYHAKCRISFTMLYWRRRILFYHGWWKSLSLTPISVSCFCHHHMDAQIHSNSNTLSSKNSWTIYFPLIYKTRDFELTQVQIIEAIFSQKMCTCCNILLYDISTHFGSIHLIIMLLKIYSKGMHLVLPHRHYHISSIWNILVTWSWLICYLSSIG